jgi:hypothetical protein
MRCVVVTESELKQLGLANVLMTAATSIGSFLLAFGLDIIKDTWLSDQVPDSAKVITQVLQPICFYVGIAFYAGAVGIWLWRRDLLKLIRQESAAARGGNG